MPASRLFPREFLPLYVAVGSALALGVYTGASPAGPPPAR
jgi:hypothetical protein